MPFAVNVILRACLHGGGGPHVGEVTRLRPHFDLITLT